MITADGNPPRLRAPYAPSIVVSGNPELEPPAVFFGDQGTAEALTLAPIYQVLGTEGATAEAFTMAIIFQI